MRRTLLAVACAAVMTSSVARSPRLAAQASQVTFTHDVAPILYAKCVSCHRAGEVAPMALLTYDDARPFARAIKDKVIARDMPPWLADPAVGSFANDARLSAQQIATIAQWVDAGAAQGVETDSSRSREAHEETFV